MRIHTIGSPGRAIAVAGVLGLLIGTSPVVSGQQVVRPTPIDELTGSFFSQGPEIGVTIRDLTADDGAPRTGAMIESVRGESPAAKAGVQAGDVIVTFDGETVRSARQLARLIEETAANKAVTVTVTRSGKRVDLSVTPQARSPWGDLLQPSPHPMLDLNLNVQPRGLKVMPGVHMTGFGGSRLGVHTQDLSGQLGEYFGASDGVLVTSVAENTAARTAGLKAGDVITRVDGQAVADTAALRQQLAGKTGNVELTVVRDRKEQVIGVDLATATAGRAVAPRRYQR